MAAISEVPQLWRSALQRWRVINRRWKRNLDDVSAPDPNEEYLFYQTLLGTWPMDASGHAEKTVDAEYISRIQAYMAKALKEAKINTSWIQPNEQWDAAVNEFVAKVLDPSEKNRFLPAFLPVAEEIARLGAINSLTQVALKLTLPGVPDIYQGNEIWDFSLVDPDNRRPVDYQRRRKMLDSLGGATPEDLFEHWPDGRIKLFVTQRLLRFRRGNAALFAAGNYSPLTVSGPFADSCVAFVREHEGKWIAVIVPRLSSRVGFPPIGEKWKETAVKLPDSISLEGATEIFSGRKLQGPGLPLVQAMSALPFAAYTNASL
jgi:(1->4)-alpha-D-glucan 1-alpha-D-glucosylmutase